MSEQSKKMRSFVKQHGVESALESLMEIVDEVAEEAEGTTRYGRLANLWEDLQKVLIAYQIRKKEVKDDA